MNNDGHRAIFFGMQILLQQKWVTGQALLVEDNLIKGILPENMIDHHMPAKLYKFSEDHYLIPGFIDLHVHGANGKDVMDGTEDALISISHALAAEGITSFLATTITADNASIENVLKVIAERTPAKLGANVLGVHLEGPFIAKTKLGAQPAKEQMPDAKLIQKWQEVARGMIKIVTLAPELPGSLALIKALIKLNIVASIGHTNATYEETLEAISAGCSEATHLFNAMSGLHQREPGAVTALLLSDEVKVELIVDGVHLHPAIVDLAYHLKHKERILLVTDAMRAKCLGDGSYDLGGQPVQVNAGVATLLDGTLAGSTLTMPKAVKNMATFSHCSLIDAIEMATINPARVLQLEGHKGAIDVGMDADLVVVTKEFDVALTMREGDVVFPR